METATILPNEIPVTHSVREGFGEFLTISVPNDWDDVKKICKKVLHYKGDRYIFRGWNSDRHDCWFIKTNDVAVIKNK